MNAEEVMRTENREHWDRVAQHIWTREGKIGGLLYHQIDMHFHVRCISSLLLRGGGSGYEYVFLVGMYLRHYSCVQCGSGEEYVLFLFCYEMNECLALHIEFAFRSPCHALKFIQLDRVKSCAKLSLPLGFLGLSM